MRCGDWGDGGVKKLRDGEMGGRGGMGWDGMGFCFVLFCAV